MISDCFRKVFTFCLSDKGSGQISVPFVVGPICIREISKFTCMCNFIMQTIQVDVYFSHVLFLEVRVCSTG